MHEANTEDGVLRDFFFIAEGYGAFKVVVGLQGNEGFLDLAPFSACGYEDGAAGWLGFSFWAHALELGGDAVEEFFLRAELVALADLDLPDFGAAA